MKNAVILVASILITSILVAQENTEIIDPGTVLTLGATNTLGYHHIKFPRKHTIIKRGAIANYKSLVGCEVVVTKVRSQKNNTEIVLRRKDGRNFFRFFPTVTANLEKALLKGELISPRIEKEDSIAQR